MSDVLKEMSETGQPATWQYHVDGKWVNCSLENSEIMNKRILCPSMEPIFLRSDDNLIWGNPETHQLQIRFNADWDNIQKTTLRIGIKQGEEAIHVVEYLNLANNLESHILIPPKAQKLLTHIKQHPNNNQCFNVQVGTDCLVGKNGRVHIKTADNCLVPCRYGITNLSHFEFQNITKARYSWSFKGPFRTNKMHQAVRTTGSKLPHEESLELYDLFDRVYDPHDEEATEYGPYQFQDFLISRGKFALATKVMDYYHSVPSDEWKPFSLVQNAKIESHRANKLPGVKLTICGVVYMVVFDSGAGSSGSNAVLIHPSRYTKILSTIEEQFSEETLRNLFTALVNCGITPLDFLYNSDEAQEHLTQTQKETILPLLHKVQNRLHYMSTRIQQLMPQLLEKFKECDIRMSTEETINEKKLCPKIEATLSTGLKVPLGCDFDFAKMISFIHKQQSWIVPEVSSSVKQCDICLESKSSCIMTHCGSNGACLKCWADSLVANQMKCMFCRQPVVNGSIQILLDPCNTATPITLDENETGRKRKRRKKKEN